MLLFPFLATSLVQSQVIESDYVREEQVEIETEIEGEVLGVLEENEEANEQENILDTKSIVEIFSIFGGLVLIALLAYIVYGKKRE